MNALRAVLQQAEESNAALRSKLDALEKRAAAVRNDKRLTNSGKQEALEELVHEGRTAAVSQPQFPERETRSALTGGLKAELHGQAPTWPTDPAAAMQAGRELDLLRAVAAESPGKVALAITTGDPDVLRLLASAGRFEREHVMRRVALPQDIAGTDVRELAVRALEPNRAAAVDALHDKLYGAAIQRARMVAQLAAGNLDPTTVSDNANGIYRGELARLTEPPQRGVVEFDAITNRPAPVPA